MMKSVLNGGNSYIPCSILKTSDIGLLTKPKMATLKGFQCQKSCKEPAGGVGPQEQSNEVQMKIFTPTVLSSVTGYMELNPTASLALRGSGNTCSLPLFNGLDNREFVSWLYAIEYYFGINDFSEHEKCDMAVSCLRNDALKWYHGDAYSKARNGMFKYKYWHKLKSCLKGMYLNKAVMNELLNEFKNLKMDSLCVKDYAMRFNELYFICWSPNDSSEKRNLFYNGLNSEIRSWINIEHISSFELLCELAQISENLIHEHEVYMESLAKADAKHVVFMSYSRGFDCEGPLTYGVTLGHNEAVVGAVIVQQIAQDTTFPIHKLKSSLEDYHGRSKEGGKRMFKEKKEMSKSEIQRKLEEYLDSLKPKFMEDHSYKQADVRHVSSSSIEEEQTDGGLVTVHGAKEEESVAVKSTFLSTYLSPIELYVNQRLYNPLSLKLGQVLVELDGKVHWGSSKSEARRGSCFVSCSRVQDLNLCTNYCPGFTTSCLGGILCVLSTPHFHFYMLMRLQISLVHSSAISYILRMENGDVNYSIYNSTWVETVNCFEKLRGLKYLSWVLIKLLCEDSISEMFMLALSNWKLFVNSKRDGFTPYCGVLKLLYFEMNILQIHCKNLLGMLGISSEGSLHNLKGVLAFMVMFVLKVMHENNSSPFIALLCSTGCINSNYGLSLGAYMLLGIQCDIIVVKLGVEPPWPFGEGYMNSIEKKTRMSINRGNESAHASGLNVQFSILVVELLSAAPMSPRQAIMVFDPGGRYVISVHEYNCSFDQARCKEIFFSYIQNLRSNSFEPGEVAAGARGKGPSFSITMKQSMELLHGNAKAECYSEEENGLSIVLKLQCNMPDFEASYLKFYSRKPFDSCVIWKINVPSNYELRNRTNSYFILQEMQFQSETDQSGTHQQFQILWSDFRWS